MKSNIRLSLRFLPLAAAFIMMICAAPKAIALFGNDEDASATVAAFSKNDVIGAPVSFTQEDFTSRVTEDGQLSGIVITSLPDEQCGTLTFEARSLLVGEAVSVETISELSFIPASQEEIQTSFSFLPVFASGVGNETVSVSINLLGTQNTAPTVKDMIVRTYKNVAVTGRFDAADPEGDTLTFSITDMPAKGTVAISEKDPLLFKYTPNKNKTGEDSFTYTATDSMGNVSQKATVTVQIENKVAKISYADMADNTAGYAATRLAEEGIFTGETVGSEYFFNPDQQVSRGDFIAMLMTAVGTDAAQEITRTGFSDDAQIPDWIKPYISSALKAGFIQGMNASDGSKVFCSAMNLTRAQAAVIMDNVLQIESDAEPVFADAVPAWASQAAADVDATGLIETYSDGTFRAQEPITRAEAAQLIANILDAQQEAGESGGFWSWLF